MSARVDLNQILAAKKDLAGDARSASAIGIVGAGGIGLVPYEGIRTLEWKHAAWLILMILLAVAAIDALSG